MGRVMRCSSCSYGNCSGGIAFERRLVMLVVGPGPALALLEMQARATSLQQERAWCRVLTRTTQSWSGRQRGAERAVQDGRLGEADMW